MRVTEQEMVFLVSVSRGRKPLGISWEIPKASEREDYINSTMESLQKKGILDEEKKLTREGADILSFFEKYRNSKRHVALDHIYAAVLPKERLITVVKTEDGYDISCVHATVLMTALLKHSGYLCMGEEKPERGRWQNISPEQIQQRAEESDGGVWVREYTDGRLLEEKFFGWGKEEGYVVNLDNNRIRTLSPAVMRRQIYKLMKITRD